MKVPIWWVGIALMFGGFMGVFVMSLCSVARCSDCTRGSDISSKDVELSSNVHGAEQWQGPVLAAKSDSE